MKDNIYQSPDPGLDSGELFHGLLQGSSFQLERIISLGHITPPGTWYDQDSDEWVLLLSGSAHLQFDEPPASIELVPGDFLRIPAHRRHRVQWTDPDRKTVWLALHYTR